VREGDTIGMDFDPMIAKISVWGADRAQAVTRMQAALKDTLVAGVVTNLPFLRALASDEHFVKGETTTSIVESAIAPAWRAQRKAAGPPPELEMLKQIIFAEGSHALAEAGAGTNGAQAETPSPWSTLAGFRL
jgi:acetyl/propionyl-CoA carboxylase alpha subunit